ncbi:HAMP domain-containing histidine kinase [Devosia sp. A8/3-2]|nr:HAMP domain-containing histidine kinase [Devosia sp. A8/3-2]
MSRAAQRSLRGALTCNMIVMQMIVVIAFAFVVTIPMLNLIFGDDELDDGAIATIAAAVQRDPEGGLRLTASSRLQDIQSGHPRFWFFVMDGAGNGVSYGPVPLPIDTLATDLSPLNSGNISGVSPTETLAAILRQHDSAAGNLWIITGGGPTGAISVFVDAFASPIFMAFVLFLSVASLLVIPRFVKHQLKGLEDLSAEADKIDVKQQGARLSSNQVPSELQPLMRAVNAAFQRLDEGIDRQHRFMADAAHELRTPIAILQVNLEMLPPSPDQRRLLVNVARLGSMADQLLDLQRMSPGSAALQRLNPVELASGVTADVAPLATAAGDDVSFRAESESVYVMGDSNALSRACPISSRTRSRMAGKAQEFGFRFTPTGGCRSPILGPCIAPADRDEIFEPFHRVRPRQHGAGLGLSIVTDIVRHHRGSIAVLDAPEGGALFEVSLPIVP